MNKGQNHNPPSSASSEALGIGANAADFGGGAKEGKGASAASTGAKEGASSAPADAPGKSGGERADAGGPDADRAAMALTKTVKEGAGDIAEGMKGLATGVAGQLKKGAESQIAGGKERASEGLESVAAALRTTGETLRSKDEGAFITEYVDDAADKIEAASDYLANRNFGEIVTDLEAFARREPALFLGGAFVIGLLGGRFLKSSRQSTRGNDTPTKARALPAPPRSSAKDWSSHQPKATGTP